MKVIISTEDKGRDFTNFVTFHSLAEVKKLKGVDTIILHSAKESDFNIGVIISDLHTTVGNLRFIYINEHPNAVIRMCVQGVQGYFYEDEFYLDDEDELLALLDDLDDMNSDENNSNDNELALITKSNFDIIFDFMKSFARGEKRVNTPIYQEQVNEAITQLSLITQEQNTQLTSMGATAMDIFARASSMMNKMQEMSAQFDKQLESIHTDKGQQRPMLSASISYFPPVKVMSNVKILSIKEYTPCRYLISYLLAYKHWLHIVHGKSVRLIIVTGNLVTSNLKYSDLGSIIDSSNTSASLKSMLSKDVLILKSPKKEIINSILAIPYDLTIVVDKMYNNGFIVDGKVTKLNAVSGVSDLDTFKLRKEETIFSTNPVKGGFTTILSINNIPKEVNGKLSAYMQMCKDNSFKELTTKLGF